jgi:hypothetical protein
MTRSTSSSTSRRKAARSLADVLAQAPRGGAGTVPYAPFLHWPEEPGAYVIGTVQGLWQSSKASVAQLRLEEAHGVSFKLNGQAVTPKRGEPVNIGLGPVGLASNVTEGLTGQRVVVGFERWRLSRTGYHYRRFVAARLDDEAGGAP